MTTLTADRYDNVSSSAIGRVVHALLATDRSTILTILRITLGVVMLPHGLQKTLGWFGGYGFSGTMDAFVGMGIPAFLAFLAIFAESAGSLALMTGITTRIAAFGVGVNMLVAGFTHKANGFFMNWSGQQKGEGFEFHLLVIGMAIVLMIGGAGRFSLDRVLTKK